MKIGIASDHRGYEIKLKIEEYLKEKGYTVVDYGTTSSLSSDYPDYAITLGEKLMEGEYDLGLAFCRTGIGMSIACNKVKGVRCAKVDSATDAKLAKEDNNANIIAISSEKSLPEVINIINSFLESTFSTVEKYQRRIDKINNYEKGFETNER